jgi:hypothetical protein
MNFSELVNEVYVITNRVDLTQETALAVRQATLKMHQFDFFKRDITEQVFNIPASSDGYKFSFNTTDELVRFRAFSYVRQWDDPWTGTEVLFEEVQPDRLFDSYGYEITNCYYRAGSIVNFKCVNKISKIVIGWYQYPVVTPEADYYSWIADEMPYAIIQEAAAIVMDMIDLQSPAAASRKQAIAHMQLLQINQTDAQGR